MLSWNICKECVWKASLSMSIWYKYVDDDRAFVVVSWPCPWNARDCRLNIHDAGSEIPERCPFRLEQFMETQDAQARGVRGVS
jgi:hypothetical protein